VSFDRIEQILRNGSGKPCAVFFVIVAVFCSLCSCAPQSPFMTRPDEMVQFSGGASFKGFDPVDAGDVVSATQVSNVYEGLLEYEYLKRPYQVRPVLCEEVPSLENGGISPDGLTYTFKIRKGVRFHDDPCFPGGKGREVTAHDFVYSFKRNIDAGLEPQGDWVFSEHVLGAQPFMELSARYFDPRDPTRRKLYAVEVPGFQALDDWTLQIKLSKPYPQLLWVLTMPYAFAVPHEAVDYYDGRQHPGEKTARELFRNHPVGTGPWILTQWRPGYKIEFVRNPHYWHTRYPTEEGEGPNPAIGWKGDRAEGMLADAGKKLPICDRLVGYDIREPAAAWRLFLSGQLATSGISKDYFEKVITPTQHLTPELARKGIRLIIRPSLSTSYIGFNFNDPVVGRGATPEEDEKRRYLRQAIACAIDQKRLIKVLANGRGQPASGPIPPGIPGYLGEHYEFAYNPERARQLLKQAGYPDGKGADGKRLRLTIDSAGAGSTEARQRAELYTEMLRAVGIDVEFREWSFVEYLRRTKQGATQMFVAGWVIDYPDAQNFLQLFYGPNKSPGINTTNYQNPEFDKLYEQILSMPDSPRRTELYEKMARMVTEDCVWVMGSYPLGFGLVQSWFKNYKPHDFPYANSKYYRIDPH
jgi:ABC-type transport system substrate-binding protein